MPARPFGKYEVLARLATGGAAHIFLARRPVAGGGHDLCVLKTLLPDKAADSEFVEMFLDEARIAARLEHPSCVEIFDVGQEGATHFIAMEHILGETIWGLLGSVPETRLALPPLVVGAIIASAAEGLHHAHELRDADGHPYNLVHRDVSPQNIMIGHDGQTKILDFGVAKARTGRDATATGIVKGKFSYMSPEQITGGSVDRRSDVYALGIVLFECLATRRLYRSESPDEIAKMMLERKPPRLRDIVPDIDHTLDGIVSKALSRHPNNRFGTALEMAEALRQHNRDQRLPGGDMPVARLMEERFGPRLDARRRVLDLCREGREDQEDLLSVLDARPVLDLDLFPEEGSGTFREVTAMNDSDSGHLRRQGYRVELHSTHKLPDAIAMHGDSPRLMSDGHDAGPTKLEGETTVLDNERFDDSDSTGGGNRREKLRTPVIDEVPVAQPKRRSVAELPHPSPGVRSHPRAPTRMLTTPSPPASSLGTRPGSSLTGQEFVSGAFSNAMLHEPQRLTSEQHSAVAAAVPSLSVAQSGAWAIESEANDRAPASLGASASPSSPAAIAMPPLSAPVPVEKTHAMPVSAPAPAIVHPAAPTLPPEAPSARADFAPESPGMYSLGVVLAALGFGVTLGLLLGVLITLFTRPF